MNVFEFSITYIETVVVWTSGEAVRILHTRDGDLTRLNKV
jgi:hypothetical protein